jgi:acetylornithine deacetylase/succinyl-diaminopimelate desuccinylase-like protein
MTKGGFARCIVVLLAIAAHAPILKAQDVDLEALAHEAVERLQSYIRVDTVNPPGNEVRAVEFFARILKAEGIPFKTAESAPGRGNIWARLEGGSKPTLILLHHSDVVPAEKEHWTTDPLGGEIRDGYLYGRGALDTKVSGILNLQTMIALHRMGLPLNRDVIFMATADEEAGGFYGAGWLLEHRPELFEGTGLLLNEGGYGRLGDGGVRFQVEVTQKVPLWLRLVARGRPGHGSMPRTASAVNRLVRALFNIQNHEFQPRIIPAVDTYFKALADQAKEEWRPQFTDMAEAVKDREFLLRLQLEEPLLHALTRNTCSITVLEGSNKTNVVPPQSTAELDCRLLPDQNPEAFVELLRTTINDPSIEIERIMGFSPAVSTTDTDLFRAIEAVTGRDFPGSKVIPSVAAGFTDSHFFRDKGIVSYGFVPIVLQSEEYARIHGNDERISVENIERGTQMMLHIVRELVHQ